MRTRSSGLMVTTKSTWVSRSCWTLRVSRAVMALPSSAATSAGSGAPRKSSALSTRSTLAASGWPSTSTTGGASAGAGVTTSNSASAHPMRYMVSPLCKRSRPGPAQPQRRLGVARHAPVPARRQADRAHLRPVRQTRALELVGEEPAHKPLQPLADHLRRVGLLEPRLPGEEKDLLRRRPVAEEVEQEEVVQLIGPHHLLGPLDDLALLARRQEFRRDRRGDDAQQRLAGRPLELVAGRPVDQELDQR